MQILDNQPISFRPNLETESDCNQLGRKTYCQLFEIGDTLKAQWRLDPCQTIECDGLYFFCYDPDNDEYTINSEEGETDGLICHISGTETTVTIGVDLIPGRYYGIKILVSGQTQGSIRIVAGTQEGEWFDGNGTFTSFLTPDTEVLTIEMDEDFDGCMSFVQADLYPSIGDWEIGLFDLDDNWVREVHTYGNTYLSYEDDWATLNWPIPDGLYYTAVTEGCYKICVSDPCQEHSGYVYSSNVFQDDFDDDSQWTLDSGITIANGLMTFVSDGLGGTKVAEANTFSFPSLNTCQFLVRINFSSIDVAYLGSDIIINIGSFSQAVEITSTVRSNLYIETYISSGIVDSFSLEFDNTIGAGGAPAINIEDIFVKVEQECFFNNVIADYCSNCLNIRESHPCAVLVDAYNNESGYFNFTNFSLTSRLRLLFVNPYSKNRNENYKHSNGSYYKNFAEKDKAWEVIFDYVDEVTHDFIDMALICDHLTLDNDDNFNGEEYIWLGDDYKPEWDKDGRQFLAQSRIELRRKSGHITNSNCS